MVNRWTLTRPKQDKETMHSFLGIVNFLNHYSPQLAELCAPLRSLILKDTHYTVTDKHQAAFAQLKQEFTTEIMLPYFDNKPIYFASRSLTLAEKNYQNLERECMAVI